MREIIPGLVWIGNARDGRDIAEVLARDISAVVHLAIEESPCQFHREIIYCRFPLLDGAGNNPAMLDTAIQTVAMLIEAKVPLLITCNGGMSRSPSIAAAALARQKNESPDEWLRKIAATGPHDVSPALWNEVRTRVDSTSSNHSA